MREKIVTAYEQGKSSIQKIAERFLVSPGVVQRLLKQKRTKNSLAPLKATGGKQSQLEKYKASI